MSVFDILTNPNLVLRLRLVVYGVLIFFSFFIFVGVAVMKDDGGYCPLYIGNDGKIPAVSNCNFPMAIAIMFQLLFMLYRVATLILLLLGKFTTDFVLFSDMMELAYVVTEFFGFFFTFIGACILSAGTNSTCDDVPAYCHDDADWYSASKAAQAGAWISTFVWLFIFAVGFIYLWRSGKIPFLSSGAAPAASGTTGPDNTAPPKMETPPNNPDDMPKY